MCKPGRTVQFQTTSVGNTRVKLTDVQQKIRYNEIIKEASWVMFVSYQSIQFTSNKRTPPPPRNFNPFKDIFPKLHNGNLSIIKAYF